MEEYGNDFVTVVDDNNVEHEFEVLDRIETDDNKRYIALVPVYESEEDLLSDDGELIILRVEESDGDSFLEPIEDEAEFDEIAAIFEERLADFLEYSDDEETEES